MDGVICFVETLDNDTVNKGGGVIICLKIRLLEFGRKYRLASRAFSLERRASTKIFPGVQAY